MRLSYLLAASKPVIPAIPASGRLFDKLRRSSFGRQLGRSVMGKDEGRARIIAAIVETYDDDSLGALLYFSFGKDLAKIVPSNLAFEYKVLYLFRRCQMEGWDQEFVRAAINGRPSSRRMWELRELVGLSIPALAFELESIVQAGGPRFYDCDELIRQLVILERQVCRLEIDGSPLGTGFLVGEDLVLTCLHVIEDIKSQVQPPKLQARFDYKITWRGSACDGVTCPFATPWLTCDGSSGGSGLDYALLKLAERDSSRGVVRIRTDQNIPSTTGTYILQHPGGAPMKLAFNSEANVTFDSSGGVTYAVDSLPGSSGSPVMSDDWECFALHRYGGEAKNGGLYTGVIVKDLTFKGIDL